MNKPCYDAGNFNSDTPIKSCDQKCRWNNTHDPSNTVALEWQDCACGKGQQDRLNRISQAKLAKARKIREEVCKFLDVQLLSMEYMTYSGIKAQLTKIIKKHL